MMNVKEAIETIEKFGIDCHGYLSLEKAINVVLEYTKAQLSQKDATSDPISRQAAIEALYSVDEYNPRSIKAIKDLPSAESEMVKCKDCKYNKTPLCAMAFHGLNWNDDNDFCSWGEKGEPNETD